MQIFNARRSIVMELYENPLITRYASREMAENFSDKKKFITWRRLWIILAEAEKELGLPITDAQINELKAYESNLNLEVAAQREREVRHDVMAHVYAYGQQCPSAKPIIHLGATSCYVGDNTDIILMVDGLKIIRRKLLSCMSHLSSFARKYSDLPVLGFTHLQPAQLTTVGKRACLWLQDLMMDYEELEFVLNTIRLRGVKGTTGTQASFLTLFEGDHDKVKALDKKVVEKLGFKEAFPVTGQTYPRKLDTRVLNVLSSIAQSAGKFSNDLRLLQHMKEIEEPFEKHQIGSSAMAYKRNPMRSERITSLARFVIADALNPALTASTQWFERTLDDSANKRLSIPQAFLAVDGILNLYINIASGLVVYPNVINKHIMEELPFMATEYILMEAVKRGGDRQELHERIRTYSMEAALQVKEKGESNNLISKIASDPAFGFSKEELDRIMDPKNFIGRAPEQVIEFLDDHVEPILQANKDFLGEAEEIRV
ncbi:MAG TPA: adenylosuccinate lyase [Clostridiales bacterium]|nr:adenylosuccinate lyase [Clostridiales bacterium]